MYSLHLYMGRNSSSTWTPFSRYTLLQVNTSRQSVHNFERDCSLSCFVIPQDFTSANISWLGIFSHRPCCLYFCLTLGAWSINKHQLGSSGVSVQPLQLLNKRLTALQFTVHLPWSQNLQSTGDYKSVNLTPETMMSLTKVTFFPQGRTIFTPLV